MWGRGLIAVMVAMEALDAGLNTLSKAAMREGMSDFVFVVYFNALALLLLLSSNLIHYRKKPIPKLPLFIVFRIFILGLLSCGVQILMYVGIGYSSAAMASAMNGLIPGFTFILAIVTRMEKLNLKVRSSQAKSIGTLVALAGAYFLIFCQGQAIVSTRSSSHSVLGTLFVSDWIIGGFLLVTSSVLFSLSFIVQTWIIKEYPAELVVSLIGCIFVLSPSAVVALIVERDVSAWKLRPDLELLTIAYAAIFMVTIRGVVDIWACRTKGPVFVSMFKPIGMAFTVVMGVTFLRDTLHIGSVIGAALIALGFYSVLWGKAEEAKMVDDGSGISQLDSSPDQVPLLRNI
ncbi:hypothetical protein RHMOL_Rhmol12G0143700 [Rhododendron molle]|uniref:Uncharacterized protein n=1 Tax=Rhododendron molle TaxID=49168 RepID=A0ACC0LI99_RHOML|nr:hypothetical protein RHMOL_Rhmol12G0143700 [Rhododendron molle]